MDVYLEYYKKASDQLSGSGHPYTDYEIIRLAFRIICDDLESGNINHRDYNNDGEATTE